MLVLALDTATPQIAVAIGDEGRVRGEVRLAGRRRHAELAQVAAGVDAQLRALLTAREVETLERVLPRIRERWHPEAGDGR